jgi:hypothetical protein
MSLRSSLRKPEGTSANSFGHDEMKKYFEHLVLVVEKYKFLEVKF